jgi:homoserine kinase type II
VHTPPDALVKRKDPQEYLAKLRFHRSATSLADYGL